MVWVNFFFLIYLGKFKILNLEMWIKKSEGLNETRSLAHHTVELVNFMKCT